MNCEIKKLDLSTIRSNRLLSISITQKQIDRSVQTIREYGLITPLIVRSCQEGGYMVLAGECELKALRILEKKTSKVVVVKCEDNTEADKLSLLLSSLKQGPGPLTAGLILKSLLASGNYTQEDIAYLFGKSVSWVSKRLTLVNRLHKSVLEMVTDKKLSCHTAQEIARLPPSVQLKFAGKVVRDNVAKSVVEKLVVAYNNPEIPEVFKVNILENPKKALDILSDLCSKTQKVRKKKKKDIAPEEKLYSALKLLVKLIGEIELNLAGISDDDLSKLLKFLKKAGADALRFYQLIETTCKQKN